MKNNKYNTPIIIGLAVMCAALALALVFGGLKMQPMQNELQSALQQIDDLNNKNTALNNENTNLNNELKNKHNELVNMTNQFHSVMEQLQLANDKLNQQDNDIASLNKEIIALQESLFGYGQELDIVISQSDVELIAKTVWGEARGLNDFEKSAVIWCILNRVDAGYGTIEEVITAPGQFHGYKEGFPVTEELCALAKDVLARWQMEKICSGDVGRTLPKEYLWFYGDGRHNHFRDQYKGNFNVWNWDCWNPYE
jgi:hypothetical protein